MTDINIKISASLSMEDIKLACKMLVERQHPTMRVTTVWLQPQSSSGDRSDYSPATCTATVNMEPRPHHQLPSSGLADQLRAVDTSPHWER